MNADTPERAYEPTDAERRAIKAYFDRLDDKRPLPPLKTELHGDVCRISIAHPDERLGCKLLESAIGASGSQFMDGLLVQMSHATSRGAQATDPI